MFNSLFLISAILFVIIDFIYLQTIKNYFTKQITQVQGSPLKVNLLGVALCYIFLIFGLNYFIIKSKKSVYEAFIFGIIIYGVYETTNYALFSKWSILTVIMDTLWGGLLFAIVTFIIQKLRVMF
uniref:DUF2177 family protein n=1 Tax=viral metagenome TaxID=1070528 RepID=A0A6C0DHC9_9ZZZZ